ncbi:hypothetical protein niasHT_014624 [Heterodera trifolii]|uniref:Uncharacterized protein n=1 Tax=Heterodera trifolii TaxID=157864 RepID=A0ABD2LHV6_9BILA
MRRQLALVQRNAANSGPSASEQRQRQPPIANRMGTGRDLLATARLCRGRHQWPQQKPHGGQLTPPTQRQRTANHLQVPIAYGFLIRCFFD